MPWDDDGSGTVLVERNGNAASFAYWLPEDEEDILATVRGIIEGDRVDRERRKKGGNGSPQTKVRV